MTLKSLDKYELAKLNLGGQAGLVNIISESGLYMLIMRSRKEEAKEFQRWISRKVLPSIRKHGAYLTNETLVEMLQKPESLTILLETLRDEKIKNGHLTEQLEIARPKVDKFDRYMDKDGLVTIMEATEIFTYSAQATVLNAHCAG